MLTSTTEKELKAQALPVVCSTLGIVCTAEGVAHLSTGVFVDVPEVGAYLTI